jgi:hypothetical protein
MGALDSVLMARKQLVDDLRDSADLIENNGWIQGEFFEERPGVPADKCPVCSIGAVYTVTEGHPVGGSGDWATIQRFIAVKTALHNYLNQGVIDWNDHPKQTAENVIQTFRLVADEIESGEAYK